MVPTFVYVAVCRPQNPIHYAPSHTHNNPPSPSRAILTSRTPEWDTYSSFTTFLSSPELRSFAGNIKPLLTAPPKPEVYETDGGPAACASAPMTEIFQLQLPAAGAESGNGVQAAKKAWGELLGVMEREGKGAMRGAISGRSLNLEGEVWVGMVGWENFEVSGAVRCVVVVVGFWWLGWSGLMVIVCVRRARRSAVSLKSSVVCRLFGRVGRCRPSW